VQKLEIPNLVTHAFYEISKAEAKEAKLRGKLDISPQEYREIINLKSAVPQVFCKIGTILGKADNSTVIKMGKFGRTFGIISLIVEEFADIFDLQELQNRISNECPPLPLLQALSNPHIKAKVTPMLLDANLHEKNLKKVAEFVLQSAEVSRLCEKMYLNARSEMRQMTFIENKKIKLELTALLIEPLASLREALQTYSLS
jgi:geranylgeranyl pyrophosphate synthase